MQDYLSLYHASPDACFEEITSAMQSLTVRMDILSRRMESVSALCEDYLKTKLPISTIPPMQRWVFEAGMADVYFTTVYPVEIHPDCAKMWVNASGVLSACLIMPRHQQYHFSIQTQDFVDALAEESFALTVNGLRCPWTRTQGRLFSTIIPEQPALETLEFTLSCHPDAGNPTVSFSFSSIEIAAV